MPLPGARRLFVRRQRDDAREFLHVLARYLSCLFGLMNYSSRLLHQASRLLRITPERAAALLLALAPLVYFFSAARGRLSLCPDDCAVQNLPYRVLVARVILDGHLPLWNPYIFGGMPLHAAAQGGVLFPLNWLFLAPPALAAINLVVIMAYALAGVGAYLYARQTGVCVFGACVTGLVWQWSGFLIGQIGHTNIVQAASLLPWLLWAIDVYADSGRRSRALIIAALIALQVFAGHPQTIVFSILLAVAYALYAALTARDNRRRRLYFQSLILMPAGLALAAVQLLPTMELTRHSVRAAATYEFFSSYSLPPELLTLFVAPYLYGGGDGNLFRAEYVGAEFYGEYIGYVGLATLALAFVALFIKPDRLTRFWGVALLGSLALALGGFLPFDLYRLVYYVPVLNLFRTPARHLMEVDFALAVLAGRAISVITRTRHETRTLVVTLIVALSLLALSILTVTWLRPLDFRLGRTAASVTPLRAPELFLPIVLAAFSLWALYRFARGRAGASLLLLAVIVADLGLWGQSSGWRRSPTGDDVLFARELPSVAFLRQHDHQPGRILSLSPPLDAALSTTPNAKATAWSGLSARPDIYMMHGIENAAGFDGFGLARYSRLADDMKLWGAPDAPARSLREGREFDLLNVRYLIAPRSPEDSSSSPPPLTATKEYGGHLFAEPQLGLTAMDASLRLSFIVPNVPTDKLALVTLLSHSANLADGETVGRVRLHTANGRAFEFALRAGIDTSEWAHERADVNAVIRHKRATIAESWSVEDQAKRFDGYNYVTAFNLPEKAIITGGEIEVAHLPHAPQLSLNLIRMSLVDSGESASVPLRREWFNLPSPQATHPSRDVDSSSARDERRWRKVAQTGDAVIYENTRALPRAWLATEAVIVTDEVALNTIRHGRLPDGDDWNPHRTALVDSGFGANLTEGEIEREATIRSYAPNRIDIRAACSAPAILVLSENHYPGWHATVNDQRAEILRVNYNLRGIRLQPGEHEISFTYRPRSVLLGFSLSIITALALLIWTLLGRPNGKAKTDLCT